MSQRYGNLFFLRKFFRNYFTLFFGLPVFTGVSGHKKRATVAAPFLEFKEKLGRCQVLTDRQSTGLAYRNVEEAVSVQGDLRVACCRVRVHKQIQSPEVT